MSSEPDLQQRGILSHGTAFKGSEPFLVGIAPNFWAHVPMTIAAINGLKLVHGIHCWTSTDGLHHVPVSKCVLVGLIVNALIRSSDGATLYVLDDGTGLIDCLSWTNNNQDDLFYLPSLLANGDEIQTKKVGLGDMVKIFGKIQCVTIQEGNCEEKETFVVREILATMVERISDSADANEEARHWRACAERESNLTNNPTKFNAIGYLKLLGPQITQQVREGRHLPAADDKLGEWRIFGTSCSCTVAYKDELLYCHCLAKVEPSDPQLVFRDALLQHLLRVQSSHAKKLVFPYKGIKINTQLRSVAFSVISNNNGKCSNNQSKMKVMVDRLMLNTIRALRHDGILYLAEVKADQYMLVSRRWVLEPYVRAELASKRKSNLPRNFINLEGAPYLSKVHRDRLLYIRRCISNEGDISAR